MPALLAGVSTEMIVDALAKLLGRRLSMVSRLDFPTSGVLPIVLDHEDSPAAAWYRSCFAGRLVDKEYVCLCEGPLGAPGTRGVITQPLSTRQLPDGGIVAEVAAQGRVARTEYKVLGRYHSADANSLSEAVELTLLQVYPRTGRTHQIRAHLASVGRPLVGDLTYGFRRRALLECKRLFLHCRRVSLKDAAKQNFTALATLPKELREILSHLCAADAAVLPAWLEKECHFNTKGWEQGFLACILSVVAGQSKFSATSP